MGLGDFKKEDSDTSVSDDGGSGSSRSKKNSNSGDSGGKSSDHPFPKTQKKQPQVVIKSTGGVFEAGEYTSEEYPETGSWTFEKSWYNRPYTLAEERPTEWELVWWSEESLELDCHKVEKVLDLDLNRLIDENPELAVEAVKDAREKYESEGNTGEASKHQNCACCGEPIHLYYGDYERVGNRVVCEDHSVGELADSGLLD